MIRQKVTITNPTGLHLRPAGMFCNIASRYKCKVEFMYNDDTAANAKSVLSVLGACVKSGDEIELICDGEDEEEAMKAQESAKALFSSGNAAEMPTVELTDEDLENGTIGILNLLNKSGMVPSNSEARRAVQQGGVAIDGEKITDIHAQIDGGKLAGDGVVLKKGKKNFRRMVLK